MRDRCLKIAEETGKDFYNLMAVEIYGIQYDEVTPDDRLRAKTASFGTVYGQSSVSIKATLKDPLPHIKR